MTTEPIIRAMAGLVVMLTLALGVETSPIFHSTNWLWLTAFAGFNLFQSAFTGFCPPELVLRKFGMGN